MPPRATPVPHQFPLSSLNRYTCSWDKATQKLVLGATGTGDLTEFKAQLADNAVVFGGYKVFGIDEQETLTSKRCKLIQITWTGPAVSPLARNAVLNSKQARDAIFTGTAIDVQASDADMITEKSIGKQLLMCGGAHKPTHYQFGSTKVLLSEL